MGRLQTSCSNRREPGSAWRAHPGGEPERYNGITLAGGPPTVAPTNVKDVSRLRVSVSRQSLNPMASGKNSQNPRSARRNAFWLLLHQIIQSQANSISLSVGSTIR